MGLSPRKLRAQVSREEARSGSSHGPAQGNQSQQGSERPGPAGLRDPGASEAPVPNPGVTLSGCIRVYTDISVLLR